MNTKYVIILILLIYLVLFLVANSAPAYVHFLFFKLETSQAVLILISALIGFLIGLAVFYKQQRKKKEKL